MNARLIAPVVLSVLYTVVAGCDGGAEPECTEGELQCDGDVLQSCSTEGTWQEEEDCAASGEICHQTDDSHCMPEGEM